MLLTRFLTILSKPIVDVNELKREIQENYIPEAVREMVWKLLCGYLPLDISQRDTSSSTSFIL